jgi:ribose 5-phosphate isomerase B
MKIAIGCDEAGFALKEIIVAPLKTRDIEAHDYGVPSDVAVPDTDYPDIARALAEDIASGSEERGILICGTGIGMAISANKVPGVRAAQAHDTYSAERARKSNDAQVITLGARVIGPELAKSIVDAWLASDFAGGNSTRKVEKMNQIDADYRVKEHS